ncbi:MAG: type II secretion system F family protein, partial [Acidimicrobiales bacterium]
PARSSLAEAIDRIHQPRQVPVVAAGDESTWTRLVGRPLASTSLVSRIEQRFRTDIRITGSSASELAAQMAMAFLAGLIWAPMVAGIMAAGGVSVPWILPAWGSLLLGLAGACVPLAILRSAAAERRNAFQHSLSCYLDLVAIRLAGGAGVDGALSHCAEASPSWAFTEIRQALVEARLMGEAPWTGLGRLGEDLGVPALCELAASTALAGNEGARVRTSLTAKARSLRTKGLASAEASAESASERMSLPVVLLMLGFVAFLGYPAVLQVLTGL